MRKLTSSAFLSSSRSLSFSCSLAFFLSLASQFFNLYKKEQNHEKRSCLHIYKTDFLWHMPYKKSGLWLNKSNTPHIQIFIIINLLKINKFTHLLICYFFFPYFFFKLSSFISFFLLLQFTISGPSLSINIKMKIIFIAMDIKWN